MDDDLRQEYQRSDLGKGVRGKHYQAYQSQLKNTYLPNEETIAALKAARTEQGEPVTLDQLRDSLTEIVP